MTCAHLAPTQQTVRGQPQILAAFPLLIVLATCMQGLGGYKGLSMCVAREARLAEAPPEEGVGLGHAQHDDERAVCCAGAEGHGCSSSCGGRLHRTMGVL